MESNLEKVFNEYNDFSKTGSCIQSSKTALKILKDGFCNSEELNKKIRDYDMENLQRLMSHDYQELKSISEFNQPRSIMLTILYINIVLNSIDDEFFSMIDIDRNKLYQIVLSISLYTLFLQNYKNLDRKLSKSAMKSVFRRKNYLLGLEEIRLVCWSIESDEFKRFIDIFAFDFKNRDIEEIHNEKIFKYEESVFILSIEEFVEYILFQVELIYRSSGTDKNFSKYQNRKGLGFEKLVYNFSTEMFNEIAHSVNYYPSSDKVAEIDIIIRDENYLIIVECKSGTLELRSSLNDSEIKQKINNKVKKAYITLENSYNYVKSNEEYNFSNNSTTIEGKSSEIEPLCLHLSMYPIDSLSSNIHTLNDKYLGENDNPKITMSFEHFLAILLDSNLRGSTSIHRYLKNRKDHILLRPKTQFDVNELDLYYQITNNREKSLLTEAMENGIFDYFPDDVRTVTTFKDYNGMEFRPAQDMIQNLDGTLLSMIFSSKMGLNKRFLSYLEKYLRLDD